ncbi:MAG TPA: hypothetical protein PLW93_01275 [Candidatus Absconditabacterales bacterium]|nr:hypothetical protein [Candidatus Absconditabacterales bacterium]HNG96883.1 hypothetical protein [Candidatus Absconditabacterales bacterium]
MNLNFKDNAVTLTFTALIGLLCFTISRTWQIAQRYSSLNDAIAYIEKTYVNKTEFEKLQVKMDYISENVGEIKQDIKELKQSFNSR